MNYFLKFYAPISLICHDISALNQDLVPGVICNYFQYALEHAFLFKAIIVVSEAIKTVGTGRSSRQVMYHDSQALKHLRRALLSSKDVGAVYNEALFGWCQIQPAVKAEQLCNLHSIDQMRSRFCKERHW
jgi:hypothetical protein